MSAESGSQLDDGELPSNPKLPMPVSAREIASALPLPASGGSGAFDRPPAPPAPAFPPGVSPVVVPPPAEHPIPTTIKIKSGRTIELSFFKASLPITYHKEP